MKNSRYILLVIGILSLVAAAFSLYHGHSFTDNIIPIICGASLIFGYWEMGKEAKQK